MILLYVWLALSLASCDGACEQLIALGCYSGEPLEQRASCDLTCVRALGRLPVACVRNAQSCEEAALCGSEP